MIERYEFTEDMARIVCPNTIEGLVKAQRIIAIELAGRFEEEPRTDVGGGVLDA